LPIARIADCPIADWDCGLLIGLPIDRLPIGIVDCRLSIVDCRLVPSRIGNQTGNRQLTIDPNRQSAIGNHNRQSTIVNPNPQSAMEITNH